jgi:hypothetical protein
MMKKIKESIGNPAIITDFVIIAIITFSVVLIFAGLILMTSDTSYPYEPSQEITPQFAISVIDLIPGIPFNMGALSQYSLSAIGLVSWIIGLDLLLTGLGLWVKHRLAQIVAVIIFALSTFAQFIEFLLLGIVGSPSSVILTILNSIILYVLVTKFNFTLQKSSQVDSQKIQL